MLNDFLEIIAWAVFTIGVAAITFIVLCIWFFSFYS